MNLSNPSLLPLPRWFGCAQWNDICLQTYRKLSTLSSYDREKVPFSMLAWMPHLSVHLCQDWWLREEMQRSNCFNTAVSASSQTSALSWAGHVSLVSASTQIKPNRSIQALNIPPLFTATFSVKEKKQRQIVLKTCLNSASIKLKMPRDHINAKMLDCQVRLVSLVVRHLTFHIGNCN